MTGSSQSSALGIGIGVGVGVLVLVAILLVVVVMRRRRTKVDHAQPTSAPTALTLHSSQDLPLYETIKQPHFDVEVANPIYDANEIDRSNAIQNATYESDDFAKYQTLGPRDPTNITYSTLSGQSMEIGSQSYNALKQATNAPQFTILQGADLTATYTEPKSANVWSFRIADNSN